MFEELDEFGFEITSDFNHNMIFVVFYITVPPFDV